MAKKKLGSFSIIEVILRRAFKGKLIPQDIEDELTDRRLESIKTERINKKNLT